MFSEEKKLEPAFYMAAVIIEASSNVPGDQPLYEERFILVSAHSEEEAHEKAVGSVGEPHSYLNQFGATITWSLKEIVTVTETLPRELIDGTELFYRYFRDYNAYHHVFLEKEPD